MAASMRVWMRLLAVAAMGALSATDVASGAIVYFPVNPAQTISQPAAGSGQTTYLSFGDINLGNGTFTVGADSATAPSFGIGLNAPDTSQASLFFSQSNNSVAWLVSSGTISLLSSGATIDSAGTYTDFDPNFGANWKAGVSPGYAGLRLTSGSDVYYGWAAITYTLGSPNQATVSAFAFENQPGVAITVAAVPEPSSVVLLAAAGLAIGLFARRC